jgi:uncharacterized protein YcbK (DUF882 family)
MMSLKMGDISKHFSREEFACKCGCGFNTVDIELLDVLVEIRTHFDDAVTINSACRCRKHNGSVGGGANSQHIYGRAADITVEGVSPDTVQTYLKNLLPGQFGIGTYDTFTHIDSRSGVPARWRG